MKIELDHFYVVDVKDLSNIRVLRKKFLTLARAERMLKKFLGGNRKSHTVITGDKLVNYYKLHRFYSIAIYFSKYDYPADMWVHDPFSKQAYRTLYRRRLKRQMKR